MYSESIIYLDNASTTKTDPRVVDEMLPFFTELYGNASSSHYFGTEVKSRVEQARRQVASLINAQEKEIIFTSGATEAINVVLKGTFFSNSNSRKKVVTIETEHSAVLDTCKYLEQLGAEVIYLPVESSGLVDLERLSEAVDDTTLLVCVMLVNNETGIIQPISEISKITHAHGALILCDATQAVGKIPVKVDLLDVDYLAFSAHKFHGPKGVGALFTSNKSSVKVIPTFHGGGQERGKRSGTLNVPGIVGMGKACEIAQSEIEKDYHHISKLKSALKNGISQIPNAFTNGSDGYTIHTILNVTFPDHDADMLIKMLGKICVSSGSACTSSLIEPSRVLKSMGLSDADAFSSIRFSFGKFNTIYEVDYTVQKLMDILKP